jgi:TolB-like protein
MKGSALGLFLCILIGHAPARAQGALSQRVDELSQQIAAKMTAKQKTTVAVVEFTDLQGNVTDFGRFLAEELITRLYDAGKFKVIERQLLNKIIAEQKLSLTGVVDPAAAKQLGKILGVEAIVSGTVTNLAQSVRVNARLISTETGEIFAVASTEIFKDESVTGLLTNGGAMPSAPTAKPTPQAAAPGKVPSQRVKDFIFELNSCKMKGDVVTCYLTVKNDSAEDRVLSLSRDNYSMHPTRLIDEFGNEYLNTEVILGTFSAGGQIGVSNTLISQVPTRLDFKFEGVSAQATKATLSLGIDIGGEGNFRVTLRNVPIVK